MDGLHCQGCVDTMEKAISAISDVHSVTVDLNIKGPPQMVDSVGIMPCTRHGPLPSSSSRCV
jgi:copper chaperone CopZ